jgi:hypothetical protein
MPVKWQKLIPPWCTVQKHTVKKLQQFLRKMPVNSQKNSPHPRHALFKSYTNFWERCRRIRKKLAPLVMHCSKDTPIFKKDAGEFAKISPPSCTVQKLHQFLRKMLVNSQKLAPIPRHALLKSYNYF